MKSFLFAAALASLGLTQVHAQSESKLPDLPSPAGREPSMPALPAPASTYDVVPETPIAPTPPKQMSKEEIERLKQDENWLVEGMKKKQDEDAAAELAKKSSELNSKKEEPKDTLVQPGELSGFKPVLANSSLSSLNLNQNGDTDGNLPKKKTSTQGTQPLNGPPGGSNPLSTSPSGLVQPILGPSRQTTNANVANLNPGLGVTPLPGTGIKKISSNPNFIPDGYADSWSQQTGNPNLKSQLTPKPLPPAAPATPRPTFRDLANTIPDPTQIR